jgi:predicted Abi (CAAX) family protease
MNVFVGVVLLLLSLLYLRVELQLRTAKLVFLVHIFLSSNSVLGNCSISPHDCVCVTYLNDMVLACRFLHHLLVVIELVRVKSIF